MPKLQDKIESASGRAHYDTLTRLLHGLLAAGIAAQLGLSAVMRVPPGPGEGVFDWHRQAFELHARTGLAVAVICVVHWLWILLPFSRPGAGYLFPWLSPSKWLYLRADIGTLGRLGRERGERLNYAVGMIHGLGFLAVTANVISGLINYGGYFIGLPIPRLVLHIVGRCHIAIGYCLWAFVIGHVLFTALHYLAGDRQILAIFGGARHEDSRPTTMAI